MEASMLMSANVGLKCIAESGKCTSGIILDPKYTKSKRAPKKLRQKGHLETSSKKSRSCRKVGSNSSTSKRHREDDVPPPINVQEVRIINTFPSQHVDTQDSIWDF